MPIEARWRGNTQRMAVPGILTGIFDRPQRDEALDALQAHAGLVLRSAARVLGNMDDAQDVAHDIAEKLLRSPPKDVESWPALLKTMAVNRAIDVVRRRRESGEAEEPTTHHGPESHTVQGEQAAALRQALAQLSGRDASLFSLFYLADLPQKDIARQLDMSENAVSVALHRVRQRMCALIDPSLKPEHDGAE